MLGRCRSSGGGAVGAFHLDCCAADLTPRSDVVCEALMAWWSSVGSAGAWLEVGNIYPRKRSFRKPCTTRASTTRLSIRQTREKAYTYEVGRWFKCEVPRYSGWTRISGERSGPGNGLNATEDNVRETLTTNKLHTVNRVSIQGYIIPLTLSLKLLLHAIRLVCPCGLRPRVDRPLPLSDILNNPSTKAPRLQSKQRQSNRKQPARHTLGPDIRTPGELSRRRRRSGTSGRDIGRRRRNTRRRED